MSMSQAVDKIPNGPGAAAIHLINPADFAAASMPS